MSVTIIGLTEEKVATGAQHIKVQTLEHELECIECHITIKRDSRAEFEAQVTQKEQLAHDHIEEHAKVTALSEEVEDL